MLKNNLYETENETKFPKSDSKRWLLENKEISKVSIKVAENMNHNNYHKKKL